MNEKTYNLRHLWNELLKIYAVISSVCEKNGLRYFACCGTALGAVRHHGFIPWDDDLDLYMPRPDYEKFISLAKDSLPNCYEWKSIETDVNYSLLFGKVSLRSSEIVDRVSKESGLCLSGGVYVDVFPMDGFPSSKIGYWLFCCKRGLYRRCVSGDTVWGWMLGMGHDFNKNMLRFSRWYSSFKYDECDLVSTPSPYDDAKKPSRWVFKRLWFESSTRVRFENTTIPLPCGVHEQLTAIFGDYMQLPALEDRKPSHQSA